jgi:3-oxoacyl-[acyl-carrier-protein] synthase II
MSKLTEPLLITGWDVISPIGIGREAFTENFGKNQSGLKTIAEGYEGHFPISEAFTIPEFDTAKFVGAKGSRNLDRVAGMTLTTVGMALEHSGISTKYEQERVGVVLGASTCSLSSICNFTFEMYARGRPHLVNPALVPNLVINCASSQSAIRFKLKGINATISGGQLSVLSALRYGATKIRQGYVDTLVTGGVEEFCEQTAWTYYHTKLASSRQQLSLGEGCAMFVVENQKAAQINGRKVLAEILACEVGVYPAMDGQGRKQQAEGLATCIRRALDRTNTSPFDIWAISTHKCGLQELDDVQDEGLNIALSKMAPLYKFSISNLLGDCFSASGAFQLAALLALPAIESTKVDRNALITSIQSDGAVGCVLIRIKGG